MAMRLVLELAEVSGIFVFGWRPEDKTLGKVVRYDIYDLAATTGFLSLGIKSDSAEFAMQSIRVLARPDGGQRYRNANELTITAD